MTTTTQPPARLGPEDGDASSRLMQTDEYRAMVLRNVKRWRREHGLAVQPRYQHTLADHLKSASK